MGMLSLLSLLNTNHEFGLGRGKWSTWYKTKQKYFKLGHRDCWSVFKTSAPWGLPKMNWQTLLNMGELSIVFDFLNVCSCSAVPLSSPVGETQAAASEFTQQKWIMFIRRNDLHFVRCHALHSLRSVLQRDSVHATVYRVGSWKRNPGKPRLCQNPARRDRGEDPQLCRNIREASTLIGTELLLFITSQFLMEASTFIPVLVVKARSGLDMDKRSFCGWESGLWGRQPRLGFLALELTDTR